MLMSRRRERGAHRTRDAVPFRRLGGELPAARGGELVELCLAIVFRFSPRRLEPAFLFEAVQCREERAWTNDECAAGDLIDASRDAEAVHGLQAQGLEDEQVQCALEQGRRAGQGLLLSGVDRRVWLLVSDVNRSGEPCSGNPWKRVIPSVARDLASRSGTDHAARTPDPSLTLGMTVAARDDSCRLG